MYRVHGAAGARVVAKTNDERTGQHTQRRARQQAEPLRKGSLIPSFHATGNLFCFCGFDSVESVECVARVDSLITRSLLSRGTSSSSSSVVGAQQPVVAGCGAACIRGDLAMATGANDPS